MRNDKKNEMVFGSKSKFTASRNKFVDPLSPTIQHDLTASQKVTALNVPLASFGNPVIDDTQRDLFWAIYLANSNLKEISPEGRESVRGIVDWVLSDPNFKMNVFALANHKVSAASAAYSMVEQLMEMPPVQKAMQGLGEAEKMEENADQLDNEAQDEQNQSGDGQDSQPKMSPKQKQALADKLRQQAQDKRDKANQMLDSVTGNETRSGRFARSGSFARSGAVKAGAEFGENVAAFLSAWGIDEGKGLMLSPDQIMSIMKSLSSTGIATLTSLIGRVYGIANETLKGRAPVQIVADTAGYTKKILSMHPAERFKLTHAYPFRDQAVEDWLKRGLGGITETMQSVREGNFICFVDGSGSMSQMEQGGTREEIAKALALGLSKAAIENGQEIMLATFGTGRELTDLVDNRTSFDKRLEWASFMFDGGTSINFALNTMMDLIIGMDEEERFKSDLVIITDGEAGVSEATKDRLLEIKEAYGVRLFLLMITGESGYDTSDIVEVADKMMKFKNLDDAATTLSGLIWM